MISKAEAILWGVGAAIFVVLTILFALAVANELVSACLPTIR